MLLRIAICVLRASCALFYLVCMTLLSGRPRFLFTEGEMEGSEGSERSGDLHESRSIGLG